MLVLSGNFTEKLITPNAGVSDSEAPPGAASSYEQVRAQVAQWGFGEDHPQDRTAAQRGCSRLGGELYERLTTTGIGLGLLRLQLDAGLTAEARATLTALQKDFQLLL